MSLFDAHPNLLVPFNSLLIVKLHEKYGNIKFWKEQDLLSFYNDIHKISWRFDFWGIDEKKLKQDLLECTGPTSYQTICKVVLYNYVSLFNKNEIKVLGDIIPKKINHVLLLLKLFPEAKFIHITQDYRDYIYYKYSMDPIGSVLMDSAFRWKYFVHKMFRLHEKNLKRFKIFPYEDIIQNPTNSLKTLFEFLDVDDYPDAIYFYKEKDKYLERYKTDMFDVFFKKILIPLETSQEFNWRKNLSESDIMISDAIIGGYAEKYGYKRKYKNRGIKFWFWLLPRLSLIRLYNLSLMLIKKMPYQRKAMLTRNRPGLYIFYNKIFKDRKTPYRDQTI